MRVFLDANVIFSAAYDPRARIARIWELHDLELVTSAYVLGEVFHNIAAKCPHRLSNLQSLIGEIGIVGEAQEVGHSLPADIPVKDRPVLAAAVASRADYFLTGDYDFDAYFGRVVGRTLVLRPADFLRWHDS